MLTRYATVLLVSLVAPAFCQTMTTLNLSTQGRNPDFSNFPFTRPLTQGPSLPSTCQIGQLYFNTAAPLGTNVFSCASPNTWTGVGSGYNYVLPQASSTILGGITIPSPSGLNISSGNLSVIYGIAPNTAAQGNDSRITGALQATNNLGDLANVTTALQNLKLTGTSPLSISAPTTGNAATATRLLAPPTGCAFGQYTTGVATSGNAICAQVQYSQVSGAPSAYTLPAATTTALGGVMVGSGLSISSGTLSANIGTAAGTVASGNDGRIAGAVQASNNLSDVVNVNTALQNLKLTGTNVVTIASGTTGNAATATSLQGTGPLRIVGGINTAMVVQSCGSSPTIAGSDSAGLVVVGSGTVTSCTIPFASAFTNPPICTANDNTDFLVLKPTTSTTTLTLSAQSSFGSDTLSYICIGR
jgi:hypothetical protein